MRDYKQSNFWLVYISISIIFIILFIIVSYLEWMNNKNKFIQELSSLNRITSQNTLSALRYQESTLKILGKNLLDIDAYTYPEDGRKTIEEMINVNKGLAAFGLARYNGQLILVSSLPKGSKLPNLMKNPKTRDSFYIARRSSKMQIGRTYYMKSLKQWVIPIRLAISNKHGEIPLVMTAGIKADGGDTTLNVKELPEEILIQKIRKDGYIQFQNTIQKNKYEETYNNKIAINTFNKIKKINTEKIVVIDTNLTNNKSLSSVSYMKEFDLYTIVSTPYKNIQEGYLHKLYLSIVLLFVLLLILYYIFNYSIALQKKALITIKNFNKELKQKVKDRTSEIEESHNKLEKTITNLKNTQKKLVESEKMASLGALVAGVAHEINTPVGVSLTGITHISEINEKIKEDFENDSISQEDFRNYLKTSNQLADLITFNIERTVKLISSFKEVAADQISEEKRVFNIKTYLEKVLLSLESITKKTNLNIEIKCQDKIEVNSYAGFFSQIITNLIINSISHAFEKDEKGTIHIEIIKNKESIKLIYNDNGKGIPSDNLEKIFEPFFTTNREKGGTGLGLNILYNIITSQLKGSIDCSSEEGKGTTFIITIPI